MEHISGLEFYIGDEKNKRSSDKKTTVLRKNDHLPTINSTDHLKSWEKQIALENNVWFPGRCLFLNTMTNA